MKNNSFEEKKLGKRLKKAREDKGIALEKIADELKINVKYLYAIESGDFDELPSEVYAKGFIRNYSKYLGYNPERYVMLYKSERGRENLKNTLQELSVNKRQNTTISASLSSRKLGIYSVIISIIIVISFFTYRVFVSTNRPTLQITGPFIADVQQVSEYKYDTADSNIVIEGNIDVGSELFYNNNIVETYGLNRFSVEIPNLVNGENIVILKVKNQYGIESEITLKIIASTNDEENSSKEEYNIFDSIDTNVFEEE